MKATDKIRTISGFRCSETFGGKNVFEVDVNGMQSENYKMRVTGNASVVGTLATNDVKVRNSANALVSVADCLRTLGVLS